MTPITPRQSAATCCAPQPQTVVKVEKTDATDQAQCCAKRSRVVAGCHD